MLGERLIERNGGEALLGARVYNRGMLMVEESHLPLTLTVRGITDQQFQDLCDQYVDYLVEYTAEGELLVMAPTDPETSWRNLRIASQLLNWTLLSRPGIATDSSGGFVLPNGARLSPDAAWISNVRLRQKPTCPEFIIKLLSPTAEGIPTPICWNGSQMARCWGGRLIHRRGPSRFSGLATIRRRLRM